MSLLGVRKEPGPGRGSANRLAKIGLIDVYLVRGAAAPLLVILPAVLLAMLLERALRLIQEMAASGADIAYLVPLLLRLTPYYLDLAIPFAFMASLALLIARLDERLELEAMLASGLSLARIAAPLIALGLLLSAFALFAGGWLEPHGRYGFRTLRVEALNSATFGHLNPRALYRPAEDLIVTFDRQGPGGGAGGVFLWQHLKTGEEVVLSGGAEHIGYFPEEKLFAVDFETGRYVASKPGDEPLQLEFERVAFREALELRASNWARGWDQKELTLPELFSEVRSGARGIPKSSVEAELYARIVRALIVLLVPLLVLPLAFATKRGGRALGILLCGTLLALAHHGLNFAKKLAVLEAMNPLLAIFGFAAILAVLAVGLFASARRLPSHGPVHTLLNAAARLPMRLRPRIRAAPSLRDHTAAGYLVWELGKWTLVSLITIVVLLQMVDLVERGDDFVERGMGFGDVATYALLRLPAILQQSVPIAALTGAMVAFTLLAGRSEMTALRAAGLSQWRMLMMAAPVPLALSVATSALIELAVPASQHRLAQWWAATAPADGRSPPQARWFRIGQEIVRATPAADGATGLRELRIYRRDQEGRLQEQITAARAVLAPTGWSLEEVEIEGFGAGEVVRRQVERLAWNVPLMPQDLSAFFHATPALSAPAARRGLGEAAPTSGGTSPLATRLYRSIGEPLAPLVMVLFALPLAFAVPRRPSWLALGYAVSAGFIYLVADGVLTVAAQVGYLFPVAGAWTAPALGALTGITVLLYSDR